MTGQHRKPGDKELLDLLGEGDIAGLETALGMSPGEFGRLMLGVPGIDGRFPDDNNWFSDDWLSDDDDDWLPRPEWLHPDCRSVCAAVELGTCCKYPDNPVVRVAADLADCADRVVSQLGEPSCAERGAELARYFRKIPGLLAQIHAVLPGLRQTARAQLLCPVGTLASALDQACGDGCPWGCGHPGTSDRRDSFSPIIELVAECSTAIRTALGLAPGAGVGDGAGSGNPIRVIAPPAPRSKPGTLPRPPQRPAPHVGRDRKSGRGVTAAAAL